MQNVVERVINLLIYLLDSPNPVTAEQIRQTVAGYGEQSDDAFHRMFERDKELLKRMGVPLELKATDKWEIDFGYTVDPDKYAIPDPRLTEQERVALSVAGANGPAWRRQRRPGRPAQARRGRGWRRHRAAGRRSRRGGRRSRGSVSRRQRAAEAGVRVRGIKTVARSVWHCPPTRALVPDRPDRRWRARLQSRPDLRPGGREGGGCLRAAEALPGEASDEHASLGGGDRRSGGGDCEVRPRGCLVGGSASGGRRPRGRPPPGQLQVANRDAFIGWVLGFGPDAEVLGPAELRQQVLARIEAAVRTAQ